MFEGMEVICADVMIDGRECLQAQLVLLRDGDYPFVTTRYGSIPVDLLQNDAARRKSWQEVYTTLLQDILRYVEKRDGAWLVLGRGYKPGERDAIEAEIAAKVIPAPSAEERERWKVKTSQQQVDERATNSQRWQP